MSKNDFHCGYIAILGRPNVGKSTLLNRILGQKISITSSKPQTTRHQILGIKTQNNIQAIFVDTPGMHQKSKRVLDRLMARAAVSAIRDVDAIIFMIDARIWTDDDELVLNRIKKAKCPIILVPNKIDLIKDKRRLLPKLEELSKKMVFNEVIPLSINKDINIVELEKSLYKLLPKGDHLFPKDVITDRDDKFLISEIIREKIMRLTGQEIPYEIATNVEIMKKVGDVLHIDVVIWVERLGQKIIVIGKKGERLKEVGKQARIDLEKLFNCKVFLTLWVKVKEGWSESKINLAQLGLK